MYFIVNKREYDNENISRYIEYADVLLARSEEEKADWQRIRWITSMAAAAAYLSMIVRDSDKLQSYLKLIISFQGDIEKAPLIGTHILQSSLILALKAWEKKDFPLCVEYLAPMASVVRKSVVGQPIDGIWGVPFEQIYNLQILIEANALRSNIPGQNVLYAPAGRMPLLESLRHPIPQMLADGYL
jgi:hypothetical protein